MSIRLGIDPGIQGAIAFLRDDGSAAVIDMPTMNRTGKKQQVNAAELARELRDRTASENPTAYIEFVSAMPKQGISSAFYFGEGYGVVKGVLATLGIPIVLVTPHTWKRRASLVGKEKDAARTLAQQLFPAIELGRKKDIGRADALLIARFGAQDNLSELLKLQEILNHAEVPTDNRRLWPFYPRTVKDSTPPPVAIGKGRHDPHVVVTVKRGKP